MAAHTASNASERSLMSLQILANVARGTVFGIALTAAGVYMPSVIVDQLALRDFHMMKVFLSASASSAIILAAFSSRLNIKPRQASSLGWSGRYDGNVIGGAMIGAGMALAGSCPGTLFVQIGAGIRSSIPLLAGCALGGIIYVKVVKYIRRECAQPNKDSVTAPTVSSKLQVDPNLTLLAYEALLVAAIAALTEIQASSSNLLNPIVGGLGIGTAQLASIILTGQPIGISGAFEEFGNWIWYTIDKISNTQKALRRPSTNSIQYASSVVLGACVLTTLRGELGIQDYVAISWLRSFVGGVSMALGSRIAGGCTSGHGISGMSMLSVSSLYTVTSMFAAGIALGTFIHP